ncbi:hypothetical protein CA264_21570 (plasmid) [Pontibacter actiniarum]|uniref:Uncharacterized protein n=1 Tax=Pontibacter actiniarum TaxID=323450 RepID=A0A1X9YYW8_9BACT|nr:hypothetical protein CA264_21570 [Pontibacter actiniarum]
MTNVSTSHPSNIPYLELVKEGRKISFRRDCFGEIIVRRKVNDGDWETLIERTRSPFVDTDPFPPGTTLTYSVELELDNEKKQYELDARL